MDSLTIPAEPWCGLKFVRHPALHRASWIDTGFTGELVLPQDIVDELALVQSGSVNAELGDGSITTLPTYTCRIEWFGQALSIEVVANSGSFPLLGVGLLKDRTLTIDYRQQSLVIE